jgi:hypothetical protein
VDDKKGEKREREKKIRYKRRFVYTVKSEGKFTHFEGARCSYQSV